MNVFVDTSAFYAVVDADDLNHARAKRTWIELLDQQGVLVCTNYVLVETFALLQHRLGLPAVRAFEADAVPVLQIEWVGEIQHRSAVAALLAASKRNLSLVDCVSFEVMRQSGLTT